MTKLRSARYEVVVQVGGETENAPLTLTELAERCECQIELARRLFLSGLIDPIAGIPEEPQFHVSAVRRLNRALRLKRDFRLNVDAVALVMELLDRIDELERKG